PARLALPRALSVANAPLRRQLAPLSQTASTENASAHLRVPGQSWQRDTVSGQWWNRFWRAVAQFSSADICPRSQPTAFCRRRPCKQTSVSAWTSPTPQQGVDKTRRSRGRLREGGRFFA